MEEEELSGGGGGGGGRFSGRGEDGSRSRTTSSNSSRHSPDRSRPTKRRGTFLGGRSSSTDGGGSPRVNGRRGTFMSRPGGGSSLLRGGSSLNGGDGGRGTGFMEDGYQMATVRSEWFDDLEGVTMQAGRMKPSRPTRKTALALGEKGGGGGGGNGVGNGNGNGGGNGGGNSNSGRSSPSVVQEASWSSIPVEMALLDPVLAVQFGRTMTEAEQGLLLVWVIVRLVQERKIHRLGFGSARGHLTRFEPLSSKKESMEKNTLRRKESVSGRGKKKGAPPPPPPDAVYIQDDVYDQLKQSLDSSDLSTSPPLMAAYATAETHLAAAWQRFAPTLSDKHGTTNTKEEKESWFHWQRTRYCAWWFSTPANAPHKTVDMLRIAQSLRGMENNEGATQLRDKYSLSETCEYVAAALFESNMDSIAAVDFLHYHRHAQSGGGGGGGGGGDGGGQSDVLPSGRVFDLTATLNDMVNDDNTSNNTSNNGEHVLSMLGPLWFEALKQENDVYDLLWERMLDRIFEGEGLSSSMTGGSTDANNTSSNSNDTGSRGNGGNGGNNGNGGAFNEVPSRARSPTADSSSFSSDTSASTTASAVSSAIGGTTTSSGSSGSSGSLGDGRGTSSLQGRSTSTDQSGGNSTGGGNTSSQKRSRRRRGSTRDPLVFLQDNDQIEKIIQSDPLHELSANEKALLWRHRKRLPERFQFAGKQALYGIVWYCLVLFGIVWYCFTLMIDHH